MALHPGHWGGERGPRMVWGLEPEPRELGVGFGLSLRGHLASGVFGRVALGLHLGGAVNEQRRPRAKGSECPAPTGKSSARGTSTLEPPVGEPTHPSHGRLTAHIGLLSRWGGPSTGPGGCGLLPTDFADPTTQPRGRPGLSYLLSLLFLSSSPSSLTKDHRKRPKYNKLLVSTRGPPQPPS